MTVKLTPRCTNTNHLFSAAYAGATTTPYNASDPTSNYLADAGQPSGPTGTTNSYSFTIGGGTYFDVIVHGTNSASGASSDCPGPPGGPGYTLNITSPPLARTDPSYPPTDVHSTSATLKATVAPQGVTTKYRFEFVNGPSATSEATTTVDSNSDHYVSTTVPGLTPGTFYKYHVVAYRPGEAQVQGYDQCFTTPSSGATVRGGGGDPTCPTPTCAAFRGGGGLPACPAPCPALRGGGGYSPPPQCFFGSGGSVPPPSTNSNFTVVRTLVEPDGTIDVDLASPGEGVFTAIATMDGAPAATKATARAAKKCKKRKRKRKKCKPQPQLTGKAIYGLTSADAPGAGPIRVSIHPTADAKLAIATRKQLAVTLATTFQTAETGSLTTKTTSLPIKTENAKKTKPKKAKHKRKR